MAFSPELEFGQRQGITNRQDIAETVGKVVADNERSRRQVQLDREVQRIPKITRISQEDRQMFLEAARLDEIPDKDAFQEKLIDPTVRRVVAPAVKAYETTLRSKGKLHGTEGKREAKRVARKVGAKIEGVVFEAAVAPSKERPNIFSELGRFVETYLSTKAVHSALRTLKLDFNNRGVPTPVRQEIFRSIAKPRR